MKQIHTKILTLILSFLALVALSGCGSSGIPSDDTLVGGGSLAPQVAIPYHITAHQGSIAVVHSHVTPPTNGGTHTHQWTQISGPAVTLSTSTAATTTLTVPANVTQAIVVQHTVTNTQTGQTTVTPHTINPIPATTNLDVKVSKPATIISGDVASLHASVSGGDGQYTYTWLQTAGTNVTLDTTHPEAPTFNAPTVSSSETLIFQVTVKDGSGALVSTSEMITVTPKAQALTVMATVPADVNEGSTFTLNAQASGGTAPYSYKWENVGNFNGKIVDDTQQHATFESAYIDNTNGQKILAVQFKVTVTDASGTIVTSADQFVAVHDVPLTVTFTGATTVTAGQPVDITAMAHGGDGNYIYEWYDISDPFNPFSKDPNLKISGVQTGAFPAGSVINNILKVKNTIDGVTEEISQVVSITIN